MYGKDGQLVVCAAVKVGDIILVGARHYDNAMSNQFKAYKKAGLIPEGVKMHDGGGDFEGFIDQRCNFLSREDAYLIAKEKGQIRYPIYERVLEWFKSEGRTPRIFSEHFY